MEFSIRAMSLVGAVAADARTEPADLLGNWVEFKGARPYSITLPDSLEEFAKLTEPERTLTSIREWARVYRYAQDDGEVVHVVASAEDAEGNPVFYRIDMWQAPPPSRRAPRPRVEFIGSSVQTYDECSAWLVDLACRWETFEPSRRHVTVRPSPRPRKLRLAWVGPEIVERIYMPARLRAIGNVLGADITHIAPTSYRDVRSRLANLGSVDSVIICTSYAPYLSSDVIPAGVRSDFVHLCNSRHAPDLEQQVRTWTEVCREIAEAESQAQVQEEDGMLLAIMIRGMLSHAKIGQYKHCPLDDVLRGVRGRRLNVAAAERIVLANAEEYRETQESASLFLWKEHNEGKEFFLNPKCVGRCQSLAFQRGS